MLPWVACSLFTLWFAGSYMADDDLGADRFDELDQDIREAGELAEAEHGGGDDARA
jgi:hypothetical protein